MSRIFITGSSDGLGFLAGQLLVEQGHEVILHARNVAKASDVKSRLPACETVVVGDVSTIAQMRSVAGQANALKPFDAVIHNVAIGSSKTRAVTADGFTEMFAVNVIAPYLLTALIMPPSRLIYLSSDMHTGGDETLDDPQWESREWNGSQAYSDTKLHDTTFTMFVARHWPQVLVNAVNPGWVPTRMGGRNAPDDLKAGATTQAWLAVSDDPAAKVSGCYFFHQKPKPFKTSASRIDVQQRLIDYLERMTQIKIP